MINSLYPRTSPYFLTPTSVDNYLDLMTNVYLPKNIDDVYWTITPTYDTRPELLAYDLYNDSKLWWVFANRNPNALADPLFDFVAGNSIYLPKISTIHQALGL